MDSNSAMFAYINVYSAILIIYLYVYKLYLIHIIKHHITCNDLYKLFSYYIYIKGCILIN